jgi:phosphoribosylaminoimidazole-succinocarboxamide synthase
MSGEAVINTDLKDITLFKKGKVRDIYSLDDSLLIIATDRISAFDVVLPNGIPDKGKVLTQISDYWFKLMQDIIPNHIISTQVEDYPPVCQPYRNMLEGRSMLVKKAEPIPVECVVRGYLAGSGYQEYREKGSICGIKLAPGLLESAKLDEPLFTPAIKATEGHDVNISLEKMKELVGAELASRLIVISLEIYKRAREIAEQKGIIIADTKFEFGIREGELLLIDELLTPDSSRLWPKEDYVPGRSQKSFDKQYVRDYLLSLDWDKKPPGPELPPEIVEKTREKYQQALKRFTEMPI